MTCHYESLLTVYLMLETQIYLTTNLYENKTAINELN